MKSNAKTLVFDLETTGTDTNRDKIVQFAAVRLNPDGSEFDYMNLYINPGMHIPEEATKVHQITDSMVAHKPTIDEVLPVIAEYVEDCDIAGFNVTGFDIHLLIRELISNGYESVVDKMVGHTVVDGLKMELILTQRTLEATYKRWTGKEMENAHDALADVRATVEVINEQYRAAGVKTNEEYEVFTLDGKPRCDFAGKFYYDDDGEIRFGFGKHKGKLAKSETGYLTWMLRAGFPDETKKFIEQML